MKHNAWSREASAIAIRADGRRVTTRVPLTAAAADVSLLDVAKDFILGLLALITGSRRGAWRDTEENRR
jgi:hypothetical protein